MFRVTVLRLKVIQIADLKKHFHSALIQSLYPYTFHILRFFAKLYI